MNRTLLLLTSKFHALVVFLSLLILTSCGSDTSSCDKNQPLAIDFKVENGRLVNYTKPVCRVEKVAWDLYGDESFGNEEESPLLPENLKNTDKIGLKINGLNSRSIAVGNLIPSSSYPVKVPPPPPPVKDDDGDGFPNDKDDCPNKYSKTNNGCPDTPPPPPLSACEDESDFYAKKTSSTIGIYETCESPKLLNATNIKITPTNKIQLDKAVFYTNASGSLNFNLSYNCNGEQVNMGLQGAGVNKGRSEVLFVDKYTLMPGVTYTLTVTVGNPNLQLFDISKCKTPSANSAHAQLEYGREFAIFNLTYKY